MHTVEITSDNFDAEVVKSNVPVLIDFWAVWCGPCKAIAPIVEEVAKEYQGKLKVAKLDVDNYGDISARYGVRAIPTLLIFKNGNVAGQKIGAVSKQQLVAWIQSVIN